MVFTEAATYPLAVVDHHFRSETQDMAVVFPRLRSRADGMVGLMRGMFGRGPKLSSRSFEYNALAFFPYSTSRDMVTSRHSSHVSRCIIVVLRFSS